MPREKKLLVGSLLAGSLGIALAIVGLPAALLSGWVGVFFPYTVPSRLPTGEEAKFVLVDIAL